MRGCLFVLLLLTSSQFSAQIFFKGESKLTLQGDAQMYGDTVVYHQSKSESAEQPSNHAVIYLVNGASVTDLTQRSKAELVYISAPEKSPAEKSSVTKNLAKVKVLPLKAKARQYHVPKITYIFSLPISDRDFHQKSKSTVFAFLGSTNYFKSKFASSILATDYKFVFNFRTQKSELGWYVRNNSISRSVNSFYTRPPPFLALS